MTRAVVLALFLPACGLFDGPTPVDDAGLGQPCGEAECAPGLECCDERCVSLRNDVANCGACGAACGGTSPFCSAGACAQAPCNPGVMCRGALCCGSECCALGQICCDSDRGGPTLVPACVSPSATGGCPPDR